MTITTTLAISFAITAFHLDSQNENQLINLYDCEKITEINSRDLCFKDAIVKLKSSILSGEIIVLDQNDARERAEASFGRRTANPIDTAFEIEEPDQITSTLASTGINANGKHRFTLGDGSSWIQTDSDPVRIRSGDNTQVSVRRAALGSYFLRIGNGRDVRVRRID